MNINKLYRFDQKISIEKLIRKIDDNYVWRSSWIYHGEFWANFNSLLANGNLYKFVIRWQNDFPESFKIIVGEKTYMCNGNICFDQKKRLITFFAKRVTNIKDKNA